MCHRYFKTPADFRRWLERNHAKQSELWVAYYKKATGKLSMSWSESVEQALCFGWIDGIRKKIDDQSYKIRFTPRKPRSIWSAKNIATVEKLKQAGLMTPAGLAAFDENSVERSKVYSYERERAELTEEYERQIEKNKKAWAYWQKEIPPYAKKASTHWVMVAKKEETRQRRLGILIESSAQGLLVPPLRRK